MTTSAPALAAPTRPASPFKGLMPYTAADAAFFFGREDEIEIVIANLEARRLTLLYGASGVGKSSLLGAGVVHRLRERARRNLEEIGTPEFVPVYFAAWRDDPLAALLETIQKSVSAVLGETASEPPSARLDEALEHWSAEADADILVVLDQFEEYFSYHGLEEGEGTLAGELPRAVNRPHLRARFLLTIREDALSKLDRFKQEIPMLFGTYLRLSHLDRDSAREAITLPIDEYNGLGAAGDDPVEIEPKLVEAVLDQVTAGQVVLERAGHGLIGGNGIAVPETRIESPYLQLVMTRLWDAERRRGSPVLRRATLDELGGAQTIVRTHLDEALAALPDDQQDIAADLFNHLVTPSGTKIAHTPSDLAAYAGLPPETIAPVLNELSAGERRILRPLSEGDGPVRYEIFHDVLGAAVLDWRARRVQGRLERDRREAEAQARNERRRARMFRALAAWATVALVLVAAAVAWVGWQWQQAEKQDRSRRIAASARDLLDTRLDLAMPLALEAFDRAKTFEARSALLAATQRAARLDALLRPRRRLPIFDTTFDPAGNRIVAAGKAGLAIWDRTGPQVALLREEQSVSSVAFSPRGGLLVSSEPTGLRLWDAADWTEIWHMPDFVGSVAVNANGALFAAGNPEALRLWPLRRDRPTQPAFQDGGIQSLAFSPTDPDLLAVVGYDPPRLRLWDVRSGRALAAPTVEITALAFSPDGRILALAGRDLRVRLWSVVDGEEIGEPLAGHTRPINSLAFNGDGKTLASGGQDRAVILWDVTSPERTRRLGEQLRAHADWISKLSFTDDLLAVSSLDGTMSFWDIRRRRTPLSTIDPGNDGRASRLSPDGRLLAWSGEDGLTIWDVATGRRTILDPEQARPVAFGPGGTKLVSNSFAASSIVTLRLWDVPSREPVDLTLPVPENDLVALGADGTLATVTGSVITVWDASGKQRARVAARGLVQAIALSPDSAVLAWGYEDGRVAIWPFAKAADPKVTKAHRYWITRLAFSPDGHRLAAASADLTVSLWDVDSASPRGTFAGHADRVNAIAFSSDGKTLVSGAEDSTIRFWDVDTRRPLGEAVSAPAAVSEVAFGPQGVVALTSDGTAVLLHKSLWAVDRDALGDRFCGLIGNRVPSGEWERALQEDSPEQPCAD